MKTFAKVPCSLLIEVRRFRLLFSAAMLCIAGILALTAQSPANAGSWKYTGSTYNTFTSLDNCYDGGGGDFWASNQYNSYVSHYGSTASLYFDPTYDCPFQWVPSSSTDYAPSTVGIGVSSNLTVDIDAPLFFDMSCGIEANIENASYGGYVYIQSGKVNLTTPVTGGGTVNASVDYQMSPFVNIVDSVNGYMVKEYMKVSISSN